MTIVPSEREKLVDQQFDKMRQTMYVSNENVFAKTGLRFGNSKSTLEIKNKIEPKFTSSIQSPDLTRLLKASQTLKNTLREPSPELKLKKYMPESSIWDKIQSAKLEEEGRKESIKAHLRSQK